MRVLAAFLASVVSAAFLSQGAIAQSPPSVSVAPSSIKVRPGEPRPEDRFAEIHAARNEFEAFQIVVNGPSSGVTVTAPTLVGPDGATIPSNHIRMYRVTYIDVARASNDEGSTGRWPDALIPDLDEIANEKRNAFPFDVPAGENRVVFVEVHVPQGQRAGDYHGSLTVSGTGLGSVAVAVTLRVWDFELPPTSSIASTFGMGWNTACVAHYGSYEACGYDAGVERTHLLYARYMLDHRITMDVVYTGPIGCSGPDCDWTHFDQTYAALFDGRDPNLRLVGARPTSIRYMWVEDAAHIAAWAQHFKERGWFDITYHYTCDEPPNGCPWASISPRAAMVHGAPDFPTLVTTNIDEANRNGVTGFIDIISPVVNHLHDKPDTAHAGNQRSRYDAFLSGPNKRLWWYQSCMSHGCYIQGGSYFSGWPSVMVDNSAIQARAQGILSWLYGVSGILYFAADLHLPNAWNPGGLYDFGGNGDGTLLYPGTPSAIGGQTHIPIGSLRLKMLRDGLEDYEYMKLVSDLGDPAFAEQTGRTLFPTTFAARQPVSALEAAREALAQRILELQGTTVNGPAVAMTVPSNGATVSGVISLSADAWDADGIAGVQFTVDGVNIGAEVTTAPYTTTFDTTSLVNGTHAFAARARNTLNTTATSPAVVVTVDHSGSAAPQLSVTSALKLTPDSPRVGDMVTATFTVQNTSTQPVAVTYFLAGARNEANAHFDFPVSAPVTLQSGQRFTYQASQAFSVAGSYSAWPAWYDGSNWHELGPHASFNISPSPPATTRVEQNDVAVKLGPTEWSWSTGADTRASGGTYIASSGGNATLTLTFTGTGISWLGIADSCSGQAIVSVDGESHTVDAYRATGGGWQQTLFTRSGLPSGTHTLRLTVLGTKQPSSCGPWIYVDAFDITR